MTTQSRLLTGSLTFLFSSAIYWAIRFATSIIIARSLGVEGKGIYTLILTISYLISLVFDLGVSSSFTYLIASNQFKPEMIYPFGIVFTILASATAGALLYGTYYLSGSEFILERISISYLTLIFILLPINIFTTLCMHILLGVQRIFAMNAINLFRGTLNITLQVISFVYDWGLLGALTAWSISYFLAFFLAIWLTRNYIRFKFAPSISIIRSSLRFGIKNYITNLTSFLSYRFDVFLVNIFSGVSGVGLYSTSVSAAELVWMLPNAASSALFPKVSSLDHNQRTETITRVTRIVVFLTMLSILGMSLLAYYLIPGMYGEDFRQSYVPFLGLLPGMLAVAISKVMTAYFNGTGVPQYSAYVSLLSFSITITLDILLIPIYGILGAALASSCAYLAGAIFSIYWFKKNTQTHLIDLLVLTKYDVMLLINTLHSVLTRISFRKDAG